MTYSNTQSGPGTPRVPSSNPNTVGKDSGDPLEGEGLSTYTKSKPSVNDSMMGNGSLFTQDRRGYVKNSSVGGISTTDVSANKNRKLDAPSMPSGPDVSVPTSRPSKGD